MKARIAAALIAALPLAALPFAVPPATAQDRSVAATGLSDQPVPSSGPRAQQGNVPENSEAARLMSSGGAPVAPQAAPAADVPMCSATQFTNCMEPGNNGATARKRTSRKAPRR